MPASGLVTAMEPILRACDGTWIAQGTGDADRETVDAFDHVRRAARPSAIHAAARLAHAGRGARLLLRLRQRRNLAALPHRAHAALVSRRRLAPLPRREPQVRRRRCWKRSRRRAVRSILVQDYHFALLPAMIKEQRPDARVAIFWHIPWPNPEAFGICPWQRELLDGLLGADLIGFHIQAHCNNFLEHRGPHAGIAHRVGALRGQPRRTPDRWCGRSRSAWPRIARTPVRARPNCRTSNAPRCWSALGVRASYMGVGVDRIDYTKGIPERFRGIEAFLENCPSYRGQFTFVQIGVAEPHRDRALSRPDARSGERSGAHQPPLPDERLEADRAAEAAAQPPRNPALLPRPPTSAW